MDAYRNDPSAEQLRPSAEQARRALRSIDRPRRDLALDGLRGVAIGLVLLYHGYGFGRTAFTSTWDVAAGRIGMAGWCGVDVFFVLSGFLITGILLDSQPGKASFRRFYSRRVLRIFPLYYAALFVFLVFARVSHSGDAMRYGGWYFAFLGNIPIALHGWSNGSVIDHFWSLAVEEQFYLVWPFVVLGRRRQSVLRLCAFMMVLALATRVVCAHYAAPVPAYVLTVCRMDTLAAGGLAAIALRSELWERSLKRAAAYVLAGSALVLLAILIHRRGSYSQFDRLVYTGGMTAFAGFIAALIVLLSLASSDSWIRRTLQLATLRTLGKYSYGVYIFQQAAMVGVGDLLRPRLATLGSLVSMAVIGSLASGLSIGAAAITWHFYESKFLDGTVLRIIRRHRG